MLILFLSLWTIAAMLIFTDPKNETTRWAGLIAFFSGFGGLGVVWRESVVSFLELYTGSDSAIYNFFAFFSGLFASFSYYLAPYAFLVYSILNADWTREKIVGRKRILMLVLLLPAVFMYILFPVEPYFLPPFYILVVWVVPYILVANTLLIYSFLREKNLELRRQKLLCCMLLVIPTLISMCTNFIFPAMGVKNAYLYNTGVIAAVFIVFVIAAIKYGIMGVQLKFEKYRYAALDSIMDHISDAFVVVDEKYKITRYNQKFKDYFGEFELNQDFICAIKNSSLSDMTDMLVGHINNAKAFKKTLLFEGHIIDGEDYIKFFTIEVTPIDLAGKHFETVILFKDITQHKNMLALIEQNQKQRIENERLFTLSQLIGGIAHNLKTPLMASSGGIEIISNNTQKMKQLIDEMNITDEKKTLYNKDIIGEMEVWQDRLREYISYMNEVVTTVKDQAISVADDPENYFEVKKIVDRVNILMRHETKKASCIMKFELNVEEDLKIKGDINYIIQVLNNLISNAIDSYENMKCGIIEIKIEQNFSDKIDIIVKDYGKGIKNNVKNKLFKQMVTTKGKNGTGLGLYISKSVITSKFNGEIRVESAEGKGSSFIITIPIGGENNEQQVKYSDS